MCVYVGYCAPLITLYVHTSLFTAAHVTTVGDFVMTMRPALMAALLPACTAMSFSWVPPRSHSNAARRAIGVPSEEFAAERAAFAANAGIAGFHADDSAVLEASTEGDELDHLEELYAPPVTDICTFGHDAPLPAMSVDDLPAPPKKGLFDQLLDNLPLPLDRQLVNAAKEKLSS